MMGFFYGCMFCDKAVDCEIDGKPADDCHIEALNKAVDVFKADLKELQDKYLEKLLRILER